MYVKKYVVCVGTVFSYFRVGQRHSALKAKDEYLQIILVH